MPLPTLRSFSLVCLLASSFLTHAAGQASSPETARISGADLTADLDILEQAYRAMHPGLLRYNSEAQIVEAFAAERKQLAQGATLPQAFAYMALLSARVRCGHTYPNFFNQPREVVDAVMRGRTRVPFYFTWIGGRMVVTRDLTADHGLPVGTQVLNLDGTSTAKVLATLMPYVRADGGNDAKRAALLGVNGESQWEAFDVYYPLLFPLHGTSFRITVQTPRHKVMQLTVPAMSDGERDAVRKASPHPEANAPLFSKRVLASKAEVIRMPSWFLFNTKWDWKGWLDAAIDDAVNQHAPELVLDIRGNEGGTDEVGRFLMGRLIAKPLVIEDYARLVRFQTAPKDLAPYLDTWDKGFLRLGADAPAFGSTLPHLPAQQWFALGAENTHAGEESVLPRGARYTGRVVVLVNAQNSSATFQFADAMQQNHLGLLLGEPTGGNQRGINGGAFFFLRLPHSRIELDLPLIGYFARQDRPDAGLMPDKVIRTTAEDIAMGRDPQMLAAEAMQ